MGNTNTSSTLPKHPNRFISFMLELWDWTKFIIGILLFLIGCILAITLAIAILSFPYYWYKNNVPFTSHTLHIFVQAFTLVIALVLDIWQDILDQIYAVIALLTLIGCLYPFWWLSNVIRGNKLPNTEDRQIFRTVSIIVIPIVSILIYITFFLPQQNTEPNSVNLHTDIDITVQKATATVVSSTPTQEPVAVTRIFTGMVNTQSLRIRKQPSINGQLITGIQKGQNVYVHGISPDGVWLFIEYETHQFGWASHEFIDIANNAELAIMDENAADTYIQQQP